MGQSTQRIEVYSWVNKVSSGGNRYGPDLIVDQSYLVQ